MKKWFTIATEGQTTDGRTIERSWLEDIAATYSRDKYGARIWMEHIRGIVPVSPFKAYGDVLAVRTQKNKEGKLELQAQIDPTPELVSLSQARQKIYTSIEIDPNFAKTGKCGLVGLAITDSPASLGTSILAFSAQHPDDNPFSARKQSPDNLFTSALETAMNFDEDDAKEYSDEASVTLFKHMAEMFSRLMQKQTQQQASERTVTQPEFENVARAFSDFSNAYQERNRVLDERMQKYAADLDTALKTATANASALSELRAQLDKTPGNFTQRPDATGASGDALVTDC